MLVFAMARKEWYWRVKRNPVAYRIYQEKMRKARRICYLRSKEAKRKADEEKRKALRAAMTPEQRKEARKARMRAYAKARYHRLKKDPEYLAKKRKQGRETWKRWYEKARHDPVIVAKLRESCKKQYQKRKQLKASV